MHDWLQQADERLGMFHNDFSSCVSFILFRRAFWKVQCFNVSRSFSHAISNVVFWNSKSNVGYFTLFVSFSSWLYVNHEPPFRSHWVTNDNVE